MFALVSAALAVVCFFLVLIGATIGVDLIVLGFLFLALAVALGHLPARYNR